MTTIINQPIVTGTGNANALKSSVMAGLQGGLLGFLTTLMQGAQSGQPQTTLQQTIQSLPTGLQNAAAKIATLLQSGQADPAQLQNLLATLAPNASQDLLSKVATALQSASTGNAQPALTSDLTAQLALVAQQAPKIETATATVLDTDTASQSVADVLNQIAPGSSDTPVAPHILKQLQAKFDAFKQATPNAKSADIEAFKADITSFLAQNNIPVEQHQAYLSALAQTLRATTAPTQTAATALDAYDIDASMLASAVSATTPNTVAQQITVADEPIAQATPQKQAVHPFLAQQMAKDTAPANTDVTEDKGSSYTPSTDKQAIKEASAKDSGNMTPAPAAMQQAATQQSSQHNAASGVKSAPMTSNMTLINAMQSDTGSSSSGGFGSNAHQNAPQSMVMSADALAAAHVNDTTNPQGFINYMSAAKGSGVTTQMISLQIQRNAAAKVDTFTMRLDPAELGELQVKLKFDKDGGIKAHLSADRPETLALLQRDSSQLERMLQQAGLNVDENALSFDLSQKGRQAEYEDFSNGGNDSDDDFAAVFGGRGADNALQAKIAIEAAGYITQSGVNIMV